MGCNKPLSVPCPYRSPDGTAYVCPGYCNYFFAETGISYTYTQDMRSPLTSYSDDELLGELRRRLQK